MKNLPSVKHLLGKEDLAAKRLGKINESSTDVYAEEAKTRTDNCPVKCVYNYEDRYRFSRILSSDTLVFDSHFESGNLALANRVDGTVGVNQEYDLHLHTDLHSAGHNQWFYFSVSNTSPGSKVKFNIVNLGKVSRAAVAVRPDTTCGSMSWLTRHVLRSPTACTIEGCAL